MYDYVRLIAAPSTETFIFALPSASFAELFYCRVQLSIVFVSSELKKKYSRMKTKLKRKQHPSVLASSWVDLMEPETCLGSC